jgi:hypothetical protein
VGTPVIERHISVLGSRDDDAFSIYVCELHLIHLQVVNLSNLGMNAMGERNQYRMNRVTFYACLAAHTVSLSVD